MNHDEIISNAISAVKSIDEKRIVSAFIGSLSTKNLPARSAFGFRQLYSFKKYSKS